MVRNPADGVGSRREDRETALGLLYSAAAHDVDPRELLATQPVPLEDYARLLIKGVAAHLEEIDALIDRYAEGWKTGRMPAVDLALVRLAVFELSHVPSVPTAAVLSEAVELVGDYSTDRSSRFVNGLLSRIAEKLRPDVASDPDSRER